MRKINLFLSNVFSPSGRLPQTKGAFVLLILLCNCIVAEAQYNNNYSLYLWNQLNYNPAYAGSKESMVINAHYRHQWEGIEGAPRTGTVSMHTPMMNGRAGIGASIILDQIGLTQSLGISIPYAYRIDLGRGRTVSMGVLARYENARFNWDEARTIDMIDNVINFGNLNSNSLNFGAGAMYTTRRYFVSISIPQLLQNALFQENNLTLSGSSPFRPVYIMSGVKWNLSNNIVFKPATLISYVPNAPLDIDLSANFFFFERLWLGANYRLDDSIDFLARFLVTKQLHLGLASDFTLSELRNYNQGSFEVMLQYQLDFVGERLDHLRFF